MADDEYASAHAVLLSEDLLHQQLWRWLDADAKAALRVVSMGMRSLVDAAVQVVASSSFGASANDLASALLRWPAVRDRTLLNVSDATDLAPHSTTSLAGLTSLTVREVTHACAAWDMPDTAWHIPAPSISLAATLQVVDIRSCYNLRSIDFVHSCVQLRCLWMPWCDSVTDLLPLGACSETLEELWKARSFSVTSLAPVAACTRLRKLDLQACSSSLSNQVDGLQLACPQLAAPQSVKLEGLVHELLLNMPSSLQMAAACALGVQAANGAENQAAITAAGAIPPLVKLLGPDSSADVQECAAYVLSSLAFNHADNQAAITSADAIPALEQLLNSSCRTVRASAAGALRILGAGAE